MSAPSARGYGVRNTNKHKRLFEYGVPGGLQVSYCIAKQLIKELQMNATVPGFSVSPFWRNREADVGRLGLVLTSSSVHKRT